MDSEGKINIEKALEIKELLTLLTNSSDKIDFEKVKTIYDLFGLSETQRESILKNALDTTERHVAPKQSFFQEAKETTTKKEKSRNPVDNSSMAIHGRYGKR